MRIREEITEDARGALSKQDGQAVNALALELALDFRDILTQIEGHLERLADCTKTGGTFAVEVE